MNLKASYCMNNRLVEVLILATPYASCNFRNFDFVQYDMLVFTVVYNVMNRYISGAQTNHFMQFIYDIM